MKPAERKREARRALIAAGAFLSERDYAVLHGVSLGFNRSLVGIRVGLTAERVKQIEAQALRQAQVVIADTPRGFYFYERFG